LIDAFKEPFTSNQPRKERIERIRSKSSLLIDEVKAISPDQIVLIKATVFEALCGALRAAGLPVVNTESLPFPGSGQQRKFRECFERLLASGKLTIPGRRGK
jgi:hypothetical protein